MMSLLLRRLRSSPSLHNLTTPFASTNYRFLSAATTPVPPPLNPHFAQVDYLIQSCGLTSDEAIRTFEKMQHQKRTLQCADKPDAVLSFLRQTGITESDIKTAVIREPRILCSSVEKNLRPNLAKLREIGLSIEDISGIISRFPLVWLFNFVAKVDFWLEALGSSEIVSVTLKRGASILGSNLEKVTVPNLSFLQEECCISPNQIGQLIKSNPRLISMNLESLKLHVKRAEELGIERSSGMFVNALLTVIGRNPHIIEERLLYLKSLGLSQEQVTLMICQTPTLLRISEKLVGRKMEYLIREAGCNKLQVVRKPTLLLFSLEKRLIPRNLVRKLLKSKELPVANQTFFSFLLPTEKQFVEKFVLPYEYAVCGLHEAYKNACAAKVTATKCHAGAYYGHQTIFAPDETIDPITYAGNSLHDLTILYWLGLLDGSVSGFLMGSWDFNTLTVPIVPKMCDPGAEQQFMKKFVLPYQYAFPGLLQAYVDVGAGKIAGTEWFKSTTN